MKQRIAILVLLCLASLASAKAFKGAEIYTPEQYLYGKWEFRMMAAKCSGALSTFFLYKQGSEVAGTLWEEVDIEVFGKNNADNFQSNLITNTNGATKSEQVHGPLGLGDAFHTYTLEWTPGQMVWKVDGTTVRTTTGGQASQLVNPEGTRFNTWASESVAWVGPFDSLALPVHQFVNWIQYSAYTPGAGPGGSDFTLNWQDDFNTFDTGRWAKANWTFNGNRVDLDPNNAQVKDGMLVLSLTREGQTGYTGAVPADVGGGLPSSSSVGSSSSSQGTPVHTITHKRTEVKPLHLWDLLGRAN